MDKKAATLFFIGILAINTSYSQNKSNQEIRTSNELEVQKTEIQWKETLSPDAFCVMREKGTEYAFTGKYNEFYEKGIYTCAGCDSPLFDSETKYNSGSGWPSYFKPINKHAVKIQIDTEYGIEREEIVCKKCGGHLGHRFNDGPKPSGLRYCINSLSLNFKPSDK